MFPNQENHKIEIFDTAIPLKPMAL